MEALETRHVMQVRANIGPPETMGPSDTGTRQFIPLTGGEFTGEGLSGIVLPGGADWQLFRDDGVLEINAIYALRTDDGAVIHVENVGISDQSGETPYTRTRYLMRAPAGKYEWLNRRIFVGAIALGPGGDHVLVDVFELT